MEHCADEFDAGRFVGVLLFEVHDQAEGAVFEGSVGRTDYYGVPVGEERRVSLVVRGREGGKRYGARSWVGYGRMSKCSIPCHDVISDWRGRHAGWRICLHALRDNEGSVRVDTESPDMLKCFVSFGTGCRNAP